MNSGDANQQLSAISKQNFVLGAGSGVVLIPFLAISYRAELDIGFVALILIGAPIINGLVMLFYTFLGYWLYKLSIRKGWISR
jgi:hypothetical protein